MYVAIVAALLAGATLFFFARKGEAAVPNNPNERAAPTLRELYAKHGAAHGVDPLLIEAIAIVESSQRADAIRWNPPRDVSVGVMQVLCVPPDGTPEGADYVCANKFNIDPWPVRFSDLKNPDLNISLGVQILAWNIRSYGFPRGVAVFNSYSARHGGVDGPFPNQVYVDRVLKHYNNLKGV